MPNPNQKLIDRANQLRDEIELLTLRNGHHSAAIGACLHLRDQLIWHGEAQNEIARDTKTKPKS